MTVGDITTTFSYHASCQMKEEMVEHPRRRRKARFSHQVALDALLKWRGRYPRADAYITGTNNFSHLKINKQCENTKMSPNDFDNYRKYSCESKKKYPNIQSFFFVLSHLRLILYLQCTITLKIKIKKALIQQATNFFYLGGKEIFLLLSNLRKDKKASDQLF